MAKYVMLEFASDADADVFVAEVQASEGTADIRHQDNSSSRMSFLVRGLWKKPTIFCGCTAVKRRGWTRGKKYGWWVCSQCHKPAHQWADGDAWYTALGTNLLPITSGAPEYRGPLHKQHSGYSEYELELARKIQADERTS